MNLLKVGYYCISKTFYLIKILIPHLLISKNSLYKVLLGVVSVIVEEIELPSVIAYSVGVTCRSLTYKSLISEFLNII